MPIHPATGKDTTRWLSLLHNQKFGAPRENLVRTVSACYPKIHLQATLIGSQMPGLQSRKLAELLGLFYKQAAWCQRCDAAPSQSASNGVPRYVCGCNIRRGAAGVQPGLELVAMCKGVTRVSHCPKACFNACLNMPLRHSQLASFKRAGQAPWTCSWDRKSKVEGCSNGIALVLEKGLYRPGLPS